MTATLRAGLLPVTLSCFVLAGDLSAQAPIGVDRGLSFVPSGLLRGDYAQEPGEFFFPAQRVRVSTQNQRRALHVADVLNSYVRLPRPVPITIQPCTTAAFYSPTTAEIVICRAFYEDVLATLGFERGTAAMLFLAFHEAGHAALDLWNLPFTGREEDVADQLAAYLSRDVPEIAEGAAAVFGLLAQSMVQALEEGRTTWATIFADEHTFEGQRMVNILCWYYGADPIGRWTWAQQAGLPRQRRERCGAEFADLATGIEGVFGSVIVRPPEAYEPLFQDPVLRMREPDPFLPEELQGCHPGWPLMQCVRTLYELRPEVRVYRVDLTVVQRDASGDARECHLTTVFANTYLRWFTWDGDCPDPSMSPERFSIFEASAPAAGADLEASGAGAAHLIRDWIYFEWSGQPAGRGCWWSPDPSRGLRRSSRLACELDSIEGWMTIEVTGRRRIDA